MCFRPSQIEELKSERFNRCPRCGRENAYSLKNCKYCGAELANADDTPLAPVAPSAPALVAANVPAVHNLPTMTVTHPNLDGSDAIRVNIVGEAVGDGALWQFLKEQVVARASSIDCWYSSPVRALIQDPQTKAVAGVVVERDGKLLNIAARKGVVLATGGYENDPESTQQYLGLAHAVPTGTLFNEGDGLRMAEGAGAHLWHMGAWASGGTGLAPEGDRQRSMGTIRFLREGSVLLVGGDGRRYLAEDAERRAGKVRVGGTWVSAPLPDGSLYLFDEAQRRDVEAGTVPPPFCGWSTTLHDEVSQGKLVKADTLEALASALDLDAATLAETVERFNQGARTGQDALGRAASTLRPLGDGPYYGMPVTPTVLFTGGGPEHTARSEVVDAQSTPIGRLYAAGELGATAARNVQDGGMLSECLVFGDIAGRQVASLDRLSDADLGLTSGSQLIGPGSGDASAYDWEPDATQAEPGASLGHGAGASGPIWVSVTHEGDVISDIQVLRHTETADIGAPALDALTRRMVKAQTHNVDVVAGATLSSWGLWHAVDDALNPQGQDAGGAEGDPRP